MTTIRAYRDFDLDQLIALVRELQSYEREYYELMKPAEALGEDYVAAVRNHCIKENGQVLVAVSDGRLIGYAAVTTETVEAGEWDEVPHVFADVCDLVVAADSRGMGVGRMLLDACQALASAAGRMEMRIGVLAANRRARGVYQAFGFADHLVTMRKKLP